MDKTKIIQATWKQGLKPILKKKLCNILTYLAKTKVIFNKN